MSLAHHHIYPRRMLFTNGAMLAPDSHCPTLFSDHSIFHVSFCSFRTSTFPLFIVDAVMRLHRAAVTFRQLLTNFEQPLPQFDWPDHRRMGSPTQNVMLNLLQIIQPQL